MRDEAGQRGAHHVDIHRAQVHTNPADNSPRYEMNTNRNTSPAWIKVCKVAMVEGGQVTPSRHVPGKLHLVPGGQLVLEVAHVELDHAEPEHGDRGNNPLLQTNNTQHSLVRFKQLVGNIHK